MRVCVLIRRDRTCRPVFRLIDEQAAAIFCRVVLDNTTADECVRLQIQASTASQGYVILNNTITYMGIVCHDCSGPVLLVLIRAVGITILDEQTVQHSTLILYPCVGVI